MTDYTTESGGKFEDKILHDTSNMSNKGNAN